MEKNAENEYIGTISNWRRIKIKTNNEDPTFTVGGILSDFELAWMYHGAYLKIINISDGTVQSAWDFSAIIHDNKAEITSVIEYEINEHDNRAHSKEPQPCLIVGYTSTRDSSKASCISFCHPRTSKILHTITSEEKITCLSLITSKKNHSCPLTGIVKMMSGSLAIGTKSGNLLIMDMKEIFGSSRKISVDFPQNRVSCMLIMDLKHYSENDIKDKICKVDDDNYHVAISIPVSERKDYHSYDLEISSLMYIPQGLTLAVGFRSGIFQLWDVSTLKKLYRSSSLTHPTPVVEFGFQEPCNDPQSFCYLWVLHGSGSEDACLPFAVMYGILYKNVITMQEYGRCYKNFMHCKKRFDMDVKWQRSTNGRCITSSVVSNTPSNMLRHINTNEEDPSNINLFIMVFETWHEDTASNKHINVVIFDMNQWYKAQMPHQCYDDFCLSYINFVILDRVSERKSTILDMRIKKDGIRQFLSFQPSQEFSYPFSLFFDTVFLGNTQVIHLPISVIQNWIIERIVAEGPNGLIEPSKYFTECKSIGLKPYFFVNYEQAIVPPQIQQRNYILTILLEHRMFEFLVRCVNEWADGSRAVSGCTLPNLIQWAWDCVTRIKQLSDTICIPLFDHSGDDLDRENYQKLCNCCQLLQLIRDLLSYTLKNFKHFLLDFKNLNHQVETLQLVTKYFDVIIWCLDVGMLPEKVTSTTDRCIPTYMLNVMQFAEQRREELKSVATKDKYFLTDECTLYIIDSILENEPGGKSLRFQWERESYGMTNGFYPPVTLQSLLRMFLMPNVSTEAKHFIMMYFLWDVYGHHRDDDIKEQLIYFSIVFFPDSKFLSLVGACWLIDRKNFEKAADVLLSDSVMSLLKKNKNLYETILKTYVCQGQYSLALKCERIIKMSATFKNESFHITLLLLNELIMEAYSTLRKTSFEDRKMLQNFFKVCDELGFLKEIFKLPLLPEEETEFLSYLDDCTNKDAGDLKVMYLLSRGSASKNKNDEEEKNPDEPPTKRVRRNLDISLNVTKEIDKEDTLESAPLEVTRILRTPHVQKRLNKLSENTPESSPLTSILKSSEMSRFKQPQKVGFNVPERRRNTPNQRIVSVDVHATPVPEKRINLEEVIQPSMSKREEPTTEMDEVVDEDQLSESTYESECTYSDDIDSVNEEQSDIEEESAAEEENINVEDSNDEVKVEEKYENEEEYQEDVVEQKEIESLPKPLPQINDEELKMIVSTIAAAEENKAAENAPNFALRIENVHPLNETYADPISEDAPQIVECNEEPAVIVNTTHFQKSVFADKSLPKILETADVSEIMSENDISVDVNIVQMPQDTSQGSQSVTEQDQDGKKMRLNVVPRDEPLRRSLRIAKRSSINCIPGTLQENPDFDDAMSVKSGSSVQLNKSKRRKSLAPKTLEIILSDEELAAPSKPNLRKMPSRACKSRYSSSGPSIGAKSAKRKRCEVGSDNEDGLNSVSEAGAWRKPQKRVRKPDLNKAVLKLTPTASECKSLGRFVSSAPLVTTKGKSKSQTDVAAGIEEYTSSRRMTRSQTACLKYGSMNRDSNIAQLKPSTSSGKGIRKLENIEEDESDYNLCIEDVEIDEEPGPSKIIAEKPIKPIIMSPPSPDSEEVPLPGPAVPKKYNRNRYRRANPASNKVRLSKRRGPRAIRKAALHANPFIKGY